MTTREITLIKSILNYLHALDGGQADEFTIHRDVRLALNPPPSALEVRAAIVECDARCFVTGVPAKFSGKMKWNLTDLGESARLEM